MSDDETDPRFRCKKCGGVNNLSDLREVSEEEEHHSHFLCPDCGHNKFMKAPDLDKEPKQTQTADQRREQKRQAKVRSLENQRFQR